jgi:hypothetical protein
VNGFGEVEGIFADYLRWHEERAEHTSYEDVADAADLETAEA